MAKKDEKEVDDAMGGLDLDDGGAFKHAICTGELQSRKDSRDVKIGSFSISLFGKILFDDQVLELTYGHRYGLIAQVSACTLSQYYCTCYLHMHMHMYDMHMHITSLHRSIHLFFYLLIGLSTSLPTIYRTARARVRCSSALRRAPSRSQTLSTFGSSTVRRNRLTAPQHGQTVPARSSLAAIPLQRPPCLFRATLQAFAAWMPKRGCGGALVPTALRRRFTAFDHQAPPWRQLSTLSALRRYLPPVGS